MSQAGYTPISLYYSTTAAATPSAGNLVAGELALNTVDEKLYFKNSAGTVKLLASNATSAPVTTFSAGSTGLTPSSATAGAVTLAGTLAVANGGTGLTAGTSGGVLAYTATGTLASSTALAASALVIGGGAGAAPSTTTTGTGVVTALGVNVGTAGAFVVNGGVLGTPASGTVTNLTGTASININGTVGATTPAAGSFTTLSASGGTSLATSSGTVGVGGAAGSQTLTVSKTSLTNPITIGAVSDSNTYGQLSFNGVFTAAGVLGINGGADANLYLSAPTGGTVQQKINNVKISEVSSTGLAVTGTLSATGAISSGSGSTTSAGFTAGYYGFSGYFALWPTAVTADATNYSLNGNSTTTALNATSATQLRVNNTVVVQATASGAAVTGLLDISAATAGQIKFPATQNASADANTLDDYEEGTWTPSQGAALTLVGAFSSAGRYTKVGRLTTVNGFVAGATSVAVTAAGAMFGGLPFASNYTGIDISQVGVSIIGEATSGSAISVYNLTGSASSAIAATFSIVFTVTYSV